jgi:hypothetical protein
MKPGDIVRTNAYPYKIGVILQVKEKSVSIVWNGSTYSYTHNIFNACFHLATLAEILEYKLVGKINTGR